MKIIRATIFLLFVVVLLLVAGLRTVTIAPAPSIATVVSVTPVRLTPTPTVYQSPSPRPNNGFPTPKGVILPNANQQVYRDPDGWYAVNFPKDMNPTEKTNVFASAQGDSMETGYLPEAGYMTKSTQVCTWLANIVLKQTQNTIWVLPDCAVTSQAADGSKTRYTVYQNTEADPLHRFVYVKIGGASLPEVWNVDDRITFTWLKSIAKTSPVATLSAEEAAFWTKAIPMPSNISVTEYDLPPGADARDDDMLLNSVPRKVWHPEATKGLSPTPTPSDKDMLEKLGYQLITTDHGSQLYRNGKMVLDKVYLITNLYTFPNASPPIKAFVVTALDAPGGRDVLIQNDVMSTLLDGSSMDERIPPILYKNELLWAKVGHGPRIEIKKSNGDVLFTFATSFGATLPRISFHAWQGHWILEVSEFVIEDGEVLNTKLGFQEMFYWYPSHDKPFYFFRKGSRIGLSYNGQILPLQYEDVMRGGCCSMSANNPSGDWDNYVGFFAKRDGVWRYVVLNLK